MVGDIILVQKNQDLVSFLTEKGYSKKKIKQFLKFHQIFVNGHVIKQLPIYLKENDQVSLESSRMNFRDQKTHLKIIYEDENILVLDKPASLLTVSTDHEKNHTLYSYASDYVKKKNYKNKVFIINRLDKGTSGVVMFAKSEKIKNMYQKHWQDCVKERKYVAIVEGVLSKKEGVIDSRLEEDEKGYVRVSKTGKPALTSYRVLKEKKEYSLLEVLLLTGRKNQIRVHMKSIGHPIVGDLKYGSLKNPIKRMGLHCSNLVVLNPETQDKMAFQSKVPKEFHYLFKEEL